MAADRTAARVRGEAPAGKDVLPAPVLPRVREFPRECIGQIDLAAALPQVRLMEYPDPLQMLPERLGHAGG
jgi:hypothetical protein